MVPPLRRPDSPARRRIAAHPEDAARYIQKLPKAEQQKPHWQLAVETLINTAEGRDFLFHANIAVRKALNHGKPEPEREKRKRAKVYRIVR